MLRRNRNHDTRETTAQPTRAEADPFAEAPASALADRPFAPPAQESAQPQQAVPEAFSFGTIPLAAEGDAARGSRPPSARPSQRSAPSASPTAPGAPAGGSPRSFSFGSVPLNAPGSAPIVQPSLRINAPDDPYEQEADAVAAQVMRAPAEGAPAAPTTTAVDSGGAGIATTPQVEQQIGQLRGGGSPLPTGDRSFFEERMGADFGQVRIHTNDQAASTARLINARAFTVGADIAFDHGEYRPGSSEGRKLLAHELTHVTQQLGGAVARKVQRAPSKEEEPETGATPTAPEEPAAPSTEEAVASAVADVTPDEVAAVPLDTIAVQPVALAEAQIADSGGAGGGGGTEAAAAQPQQKDARGNQATAIANNASAAPGDAAPGDGAPKATAEATPTEGSATSAPPPAPTPKDVPPPAKHAEATTADAEPKAASAAQASETRAADPRMQERPAAAQDATGAATAADKEEELQQRVGTGPRIQRAPARPRSPSDDPAFQGATQDLSAAAQTQKQHAPAEQKASEAQAAAQMPEAERTGAAQHTQATVLSATAAAQEAKAQGGQAPGFDQATFVAAIKSKITALTPQDPKEMEKIGSSGVFDQVQGGMAAQVAGGKDQAKGQVDDQAQAAPDTASVAEKPTTPLLPNAPGQAPTAPEATGTAAAPKPASAAEVEAPIQAESAQLDTQMAQAQLTPEQLQKSNEPAFTAALDAKTQAQQESVAATAAYRANEQGDIGAAQAQAQGLAAGDLADLGAARSAHYSDLDALQHTGTGENEAARAQIGAAISRIYEDTRAKVDDALKTLDTDVDKAFSEGAAKAKQEAVDWITQQTTAYKNERYGTAEDSDGMDRFTGVFKQGWDTITSMPPEYFTYFNQGRDRYLAAMDTVLLQVAQIVATQLGKAHTVVEEGRKQIADEVAKQPAELRQLAEELAAEAQSNFDSLDQSIDAKQQELVDHLAQQYTAKVQELDADLDAMKQAAKGLLGKAGDMLGGVATTIMDMRAMLEDVLRNGRSAIGAIMQDPIAFLGNLLNAVGQGLHQFGANIGTHLQAGLISWLTGTLSNSGIQLPKAFDLAGIFDLVMQILGLTYDQVKGQVITALGPHGAEIVAALEGGWEVFQVLKQGGIAALWQFVQDQIGDLKAMVLDQIKEMVMGQVIKAGLEWLISLLGGPAGAFVQAVKGIVKVVTWFTENAARLASLLNAIFSSISAIAAGDIGGAANFIEQSLATALPTVISFLANLLGLGDIAKKVQGIIEGIRKRVQDAIAEVIKRAVAIGKRLWSKVRGVGRGARHNGAAPSDLEEPAPNNAHGGADDEIGKQVNFSAGKERHRLWVQVSGTSATLMVASTPITVEERLKEWEGKLSTIPGKKRADAQALIAQARQIAGATDQKADKLAKSAAASGATAAPTTTATANTAAHENQAVAEGETKLADIMKRLFGIFNDLRERFAEQITLVDPAVRGIVEGILEKESEDEKSPYHLFSWEDVVQSLRKTEDLRKISAKPLHQTHKYGSEVAHPQALDQFKIAIAKYNGDDKIDKKFSSDPDRSLNARKNEIYKNEGDYEGVIQLLREQIFNTNIKEDASSAMLRVFDRVIVNQSRGVKSADDVFKDTPEGIKAQIIKLVNETPEGEWIATFACKGRQFLKKEDVVLKDFCMGDIWDEQVILENIFNAMRKTLRLQGISEKDIEGLDDELNEISKKTANYLLKKPLFSVQSTDIPRYLKAAKTSDFINVKEGKDISPHLHKSISGKYNTELRIKFGQEVHHALPIYLGGSHPINNLLGVYGKAREDVIESAHAELHQWIESESLEGLDIYFRTMDTEPTKVELNSLTVHDIGTCLKEHGCRVLIGVLQPDGNIVYTEHPIDIPMASSDTQDE